MGGLIGKILSFVRVERNNAKLSDVKNDVGGGEVLTAEYAQPSGEDGHPLPGDYVLSVKIPRSGRYVTVAVVEPDAKQEAQPGEKRIYARDPETREPVVTLHLKADGSAVLHNENGSYTLEADGSHQAENAEGSYRLDADGTHTLRNDNASTTMRPNGSCRTENNSGYWELQASGTVEVNGATIDPGGNIVATSVSAPSIVADGKELADHDHDILSGSSSPGPTGPNN